MFFLLNRLSTLKYAIFCVVIFFSAFQSCDEPKEYRVNSSFSLYLQRFEREAATRGRFFDLKSKGLIIEFAHLPNSIAGLTHYEDPIRIEIDKSYWDIIGKYAGADLMREDLMFHELGHGLLNRKHLNTTLPNGDWKSMMCGGDKVNHRNWNINYHGLRRSYYINELFDELATTPELLDPALLVDTAGFNVKGLYYSFDSPSFKDTGWPIGDSINYSLSIDNGSLCFNSKSKNQQKFLIRTKIDFQQDFILQLRLSCLSDNLESQYGLVFGSVADKNRLGTLNYLEYLTINNRQLMFMGNGSWFSYFTELYRPEIVSKGMNLLRVVKKGALLYYFINNKYIYCNESESVGVQNYIGIVVPPFAVVFLDDLLVLQNKDLLNSSPAVKKQGFGPELIHENLLYREVTPIR